MAEKKPFVYNQTTGEVLILVDESVALSEADWLRLVGGGARLKHIAWAGTKADCYCGDHFLTLCESSKKKIHISDMVFPTNNQEYSRTSYPQDGSMCEKCLEVAFGPKSKPTYVVHLRTRDTYPSSSHSECKALVFSGNSTFEYEYVDFVKELESGLFLRSQDVTLIEIQRLGLLPYRERAYKHAENKERHFVWCWECWRKVFGAQEPSHLTVGKKEDTVSRLLHIKRRAGGQDNIVCGAIAADWQWMSTLRQFYDEDNEKGLDVYRKQHSRVTGRELEYCKHCLMQMPWYNPQVKQINGEFIQVGGLAELVEESKGHTGEIGEEVNTVMEQLQKAAKAGIKQTIAKQGTKTALKVIAAQIKRSKLNQVKKALILEALGNDYTVAGINGLLGLGLMFIPKYQNNEKAQELAALLITTATAEGTNELFEQILSPLIEQVLDPMVAQMTEIIEPKALTAGGTKLSDLLGEVNKLEQFEQEGANRK